MRRPTPRLVVLLAAGSLLLGGCVRRALTIRTTPPGAMVYLNDRLMGDSPVTFDFMWYGWHRIMLRKDGFDRLDDHRQLRCPLYLWIPLDLVMELLPIPIRDRRTWDYTLTPAAVPPAPTAPVSPAPEAPAAAATAAPSTPPALAPAAPETHEERHDPR